jgi:hypothetical protein
MMARAVLAMPESGSVGGQIANPGDWREWLSAAPQLYDALTDWLRGQPFRLTLHKSLDGASGSYVALVEYRPDHGRMSDRIIKLLPPEIGATESFGVQQAIQHSSEHFARRHLVSVERPGQLGGTGWWVYLQEVAQGGLTNARPLSSLLNDPELGRYCGVIVASLVKDWQQHSDADPARMTAADFLGDFLRDSVGYPAAPDGSLNGLLPASLTGNAADLTFTWLDGRELPNPMALVSGGLGGDMGKVRVFRGNGHGDLHDGNILVPTELRVDPAGYKLVDLGRFSAETPVSRDPMKLLLSLSAAWLKSIAPDSPIRGNLAEMVVAPWLRRCMPMPGTKGYLEVAVAIHRAARSWADTRSFGHDWDRQNWLVLAASALRYAARPDLARDDRWWFFGVAALATWEMLSLDSPGTERAALPRPEHEPAPPAPEVKARAESQGPAAATEPSRPRQQPGHPEDATGPDAGGPGLSGPGTSRKGSGRGGKRALIITASLTAGTAVAAVITVYILHWAGNAAATSARCIESRNLAAGGAGPDPRTKLSWPAIYWCPQGTDTVVYVNADYNQPFDYLNPAKSFWVVCWSRGQDGKAWYYTEGDREYSSDPETDSTRYNAWGWVSADALNVTNQPAYPVTECPPGTPGE